MDKIIQHFRKDEQPFIETVSGWIREVEDRYAPKLTGFLDPRQRFIVQSMLGGSELLWQADGNFSDAERQRMLIYPNYFVPEKEDFQLTVFQVKYATKFLTIEHRDVLGSLMSLGIDRAKFGDIRIEQDIVQFAVAAELDDYLIANFNSIGKAKVAIEMESDSENWIQYSDEWVEELHIVSSLRLDVIVAAITNSSRQKATMLIQRENVKVNWTTRDEPAFELQESDLLSVRGAGRFNIMAIEGRTKKEKIRLLIGRLE
ncbi:RNA-binding protein [Sporosarcina sp. HYO08]|uniref:YlmH family RNA-binding protein n=1 Tax=Sporosarcina sp. HYO08 TaxID=1759557 RepID=UPI00079BBF12|nr:YlmH/Sll1252 family protein [Sporosarcina sp. HYO08]KXH79912.1 RNA-binding protein [Sporosarcina sp. HYO08]